MSYSVKSISVFEKQAKRLFKKFPSLKKEIQLLAELLKENPTSGTSLGKNCFKIRLSISSKGKGKRGGARIITNVVVIEETVYLLSIYDKSEIDNITDEELNWLLSFIPS